MCLVVGHARDLEPREEGAQHGQRGRETLNCDRQFPTEEDSEVM